MDSNKNVWDLIKDKIGDVKPEDVEKVAKKYLNDLAERGTEKWHEEQNALDSFKEALDHMSENDLRIYVPDVYQKSIYDIDYEKLKDSGIKLLSFDIDDTIDDVLLNNIKARVSIVEFTMPKKAIELFQNLSQ